MKGNDSGRLDHLSGSISLDTGVLIEFFSESPLGGLIADKIFKNPDINKIFIHDYLITEIFYVFCRQKGKEVANTVVDDLINVVTVVDVGSLRLIAGELKCQRSLSLADCYSCAVAIYKNCPIIFKREKELIEEQNKRSFEFDLILV